MCNFFFFNLLISSGFGQLDEEESDNSESESEEEEENEENEKVTEVNNGSTAAATRLADEFRASVEEVLDNVVEKEMSVEEMKEQLREVREGLWLLRQAAQLNMEGEQW